MIHSIVGGQHGVAHSNHVGPPVEAQRYHPEMFPVQGESGTPTGYESSTPKRDISCAAYRDRTIPWYSWLIVGHGWNSVWVCYHLVWVFFQTLLPFLAHHMEVYKASDDVLREGASGQERKVAHYI